MDVASNMVGWLKLLGVVVLLVVGHVMMYIGALFTGGGHASLAMLASFGSWYSLIVLGAKAIDGLSIGGRVWLSTIGSDGAMGHVLGNLLLVEGFFVFYIGVGWLVRSYWVAGRFRWVGFWLVGSILGGVVCAILEGRDFRLAQQLMYTAAGFVMAGLFVLLDEFFHRFCGKSLSKR